MKITIMKNKRFDKISTIKNCLMILFAAGTLLLIAGCSKNQKASQQTIYHPNKRIDYLITEFNKISSTKITNVPRDFSYQVFLTHDDMSIRISSNDHDTFVDISNETVDDGVKNILACGDIFIRIAQPSVAPVQIQQIHQEMLSKKYQNYDEYAFIGLEFKLDDTRLHNGQHRYKYSISIPNGVLSIK